MKKSKNKSGPSELSPEEKITAACYGLALKSRNLGKIKTIGELARHFGVSRPTVYEWIRILEKRVIWIFGSNAKSHAELLKENGDLEKRIQELISENQELRWKVDGYKSDDTLDDEL